MSSSAAVHSEVHGGGWHAWGLPGLFLLGFLDGAGIPTMGGPDIMLLYLCMSAKGALEVILIAFIAALSESLGSVVLLQVARATSDYAQKKLGVPLKWWNSMRKHATRLSPFWLVVLLGMIPPPLPKKPVPIFCGALHIPTSIFVPALTIGRWIGFLVLGTLGAVYGDKFMVMISEQKALFVRILVAICFLALVAAAFLYHFRPKWLFASDDDEDIDERIQSPSISVDQMLYHQNMLLKAHGRSLEPRVVNDSPVRGGSAHSSAADIHHTATHRTAIHFEV